MTSSTLARSHGQLDHTDRFVRRHVGPSPLEIRQMLAYLEVASTFRSDSDYGQVMRAIR